MTDDLARVQRCDIRERAEGHDKYSRLVSQAGEAGVAGDVRTCVKLNTKAIEMDPTRAPGHLQLANAYFNSTSFAKALEIFEKVRVAAEAGGMGGRSWGDLADEYFALAAVGSYGCRSPSHSLE